MSDALAGFGPRLALGFAAFFAIQGIYLPFFPLWLKGEGLSAEQIAFVLALPAVMRVAAIMPLTALADRSPERARLVVLFWVAAALAMSMHLLVAGFVAIAVVHAVLALVWLPQLPIVDALTLEGVRRFGTDYGRVRLWGSIAFLLANLAGGALFARMGHEAVLWVLVAGFWAAALASVTTPRLGRAATRVNEGGANGGGAGFGRFLRRRSFALVMLGAGLVQAAHAFSYGFSAIYWSDRGWSEITIGALWAVSVLAEVVLFQFVGSTLRRVGPGLVLLVGAGGAVVRWSLFPLEPGVLGTVVLQIMHAASFGATHLGQQLFIAERVAAGEATSAQGFATVLGGVTMGAAGLASGWLYARHGVDGFFAMAALAAVGGACLWAGLGRDRGFGLRERA